MPWHLVFIITNPICMQTKIIGSRFVEIKVTFIIVLLLDMELLAAAYVHVYQR